MEPTPKNSSSSRALTGSLAVLIALSLWQNFRITDLKNQIDHLRQRTDNISSQVDRTISRGIGQLRLELEQQASPLVESQVQLLGMAEQEGDPMAQAALSVTLKEGASDTRVRFLLTDRAGETLEADAERQGSGNVYSARLTLPLGGEYTAAALILRGDAQEQVQLEELLPLRSLALQIDYHPNYYEKINMGQVELEHTYDLYVFPSEYNWGKSLPNSLRAELSIRKNGVEIGRCLPVDSSTRGSHNATPEPDLAEKVESYQRSFQVKETIALEEGDQVKIVSVVEDGMGLRYEQVLWQMRYTQNGSEIHPGNYGEYGTMVYYGDTLVGQY